jgi:hypothetical protein
MDQVGIAMRAGELDRAMNVGVTVGPMVREAEGEMLRMAGLMSTKRENPDNPVIWRL